MQSAVRVRFAVAAAAFALGFCGSTSAGIINGSFETGDFSGWQVIQPTFASVLTTAPKVFADSDVGSSSDPNWLPTHGDYFAYLASGAEKGRYTLLSQAFNASAGDVVSFDIFFDAGDYLPFNDNGFANILNLGTLDLDNLYLQSVQQVGDYGEDGWTHISYVIPQDGEYRLLFGVNNDGDNLQPSYLGVDNVILGPRGGGEVPEPSTVLIWGLLGAAALVHTQRCRAKTC
jgi:hypothetical protein